MKIVAIEDSEEFLMLYKLYLQKNFTHEFVPLKTSSKVFKTLDFSKEEVRARFKDLDLVILDYFIPKANGQQILTWLKKFPEFEDIPIIMITGNQSEEAVVRAFESGIFDFIRKPFSISEFVTRVSSAIRFKKEIDLRKKRESELQRANLRLKMDLNVLKELNMTDPLTSVFNRRYLDIHLKNEFSQSRLFGKPMSILLLDVDYFKYYNDTYGHMKGDECLISIAKGIRSALEDPGYVVCRYGGEEFIIILSSVDKNSALIVAEKIRKTIENLSIQHSNSSCANVVTVSIGGVDYNGVNDLSLEELIQSADNQLYKAKKSGRNKCMFESISQI